MTKRRPFDVNRLARGSTEHHVGCKRNDIRIMAGFDPETFQQIRQYAIRNKLSMTGAIRDLVEFGLEDCKDGLEHKSASQA